MRFRKILLSWKLWWRAVQSRRSLRRAIAKAKLDLAQYRSDIDRITAFYERELAISRRSHYLLHNEWANRFLQIQKLPPISLAVANVEDDVTTKTTFDKKPDPVESLTADQYTYFADLQRSFWEDGKSMGKSEGEINQYWNQKRDEILATVVQEVHGESTDLAG